MMRDLITAEATLGIARQEAEIDGLEIMKESDPTLFKSLWAKCAMAEKELTVMIAHAGIGAAYGSVGEEVSLMCVEAVRKCALVATETANVRAALLRQVSEVVVAAEGDATGALAKAFEGIVDATVSARQNLSKDVVDDYCGDKTTEALKARLEDQARELRAVRDKMFRIRST